jgi:hypothetical protein
VRGPGSRAICARDGIETLRISAEIMKLGATRRHNLIIAISPTLHELTKLDGETKPAGPRAAGTVALSVSGQLLAAPPAMSKPVKLAERKWRHPITGEPGPHRRLLSQFVETVSTLATWSLEAEPTGQQKGRCSQSDIAGRFANIADALVTLRGSVLPFRA